MPQDGGGRTVGDDLAEMRRLADEPVISETQLKANLGQIYALLFHADLAHYDVAVQRKAAALAIQNLFELRLSLRNRIADWERRGFMSRDVQRALRDVFRVTRYASDMIGELNIGHDRLPPGAAPKRGFTGADVNVLVNPAHQMGGDFPFQSGDIVLVRGQAHNSAAIARIGDIDSQFSHVGVVYVDKAGEPHMVEALIEAGAIVRPLEEALDHRLGRAVLFRHRDQALAARAAEAIHAHVSKRRIRRIWYDFTMALEGYKSLYCSKLVRLAYLKASRGDVSLPAYTTMLDMKNRDFLDRVGVTTVQTFAPGDFEIDPRFDVVAEWQDYRVTSSLRNQDMIATKLFEFMETHHYRFEEDTSIKLIGWLGRLAAHLSEPAKDLISDVVPKVPPNMKRQTIAVIAMLHKTAQPLLEQLMEKDQAEIARSGRPLHPRETLAFLEEIRRTSGGRIGYLAAKS
jgi:hypothetical protein